MSRALLLLGRPAVTYCQHIRHTVPVVRTAVVPCIHKRNMSDTSDVMHKVNMYDRYVLVKGNMYKSADDVPEEVPLSKLARAKDMFRIRLNIYIGIVGIIMFGTVIFSARRYKQERINRRQVD